MGEDNVEVKKESPQEPPKEPSTGGPGFLQGISKNMWIMIGGGAGLILLIIIILLLIPGGGDPIAALLPEDTFVYVGVNLLKAQDEDVDKVFEIFQEASGEKAQPIAEYLEDMMDDALNMSFEDDVLPWIGQYVGYAVVDMDFGDYGAEDLQTLYIIQARSTKGADQFIEDVVDAFDDELDIKFDEDEKDGITYYIYEAESDWEEDMVIARVGKFVYFANNEDLIFDSADLKKSESLANFDLFKAVQDELSSGWFASIYVKGEVYSETFGTMADFYGSFGMSLGDMEDMSADAYGVGLSVEKVGLRIDIASAYDKNDLSDYQEASLDVSYKSIKADKYFPEDTFFFMATNSSMNPGAIFDKDSDFYLEDLQEAIEIFEDEYDIDFQEFFEMMDGEVAIGIGPAKDGLFAESMDVEIGFMMLFATKEEDAFDKWMEDLLDNALDDGYTEYDFDDFDLGDIELQELSIEDYTGESVSTLIFGTGEGYMILSTSGDMLEAGFEDDAPLSKNEVYKDTWKAFPSGSTPYFYLDLQEFLKFIEDAYPYDDFEDTQDALEAFTVIAGTTNKSSKYTSSTTIIFFMELD